MRLRHAAVVVALACAQCGGTPDGPGALSTPPSPAREGVDGADGAFGAAWVGFATQARVTDEVVVEVTFPARADGTLDAARAPYPPVVFLQGTGIGGDRFRWLAAHVATRGYVVIAPGHPLNIAAFEPDNASIALAAVRAAASGSGTLRGAVAPGAPAAIMGHSLGGIIAARQWISNAAFRGVALLAAQPADRDDVARRAGSPALVMAGTSDVPAPPSSVQAGFARFAAPRDFGLVEGMNHYGWSDSVTGSELSSDGPRPADLAATRRAALAVVDAWLDATLRDDRAARARLDRGEFTGVRVTR